MNKDIGKIIKKRRRKLKLTQGELAEKLGVTASTISNWENGINLPDEKLKDKISKILNIKYNKFEEKDKKKNYEIVVCEEESKHVKRLQKIFSSCISYVLVTILLVTGYTLIYNYVSNDMYYETYRQISTTTNEEIIAEADKNLEIIKNSHSIIDEKAPEYKQAMIKILEAYSYKLHNFKEYDGKNNYEYMKYVSKELNLNIFDYESTCFSVFNPDSINDKKCDLKKEKRLFSSTLTPMVMLSGMDKKTKGFVLNDKNYKCTLKNCKYLKNQMYILGYSKNYSIVLNAYFPNLKTNNINNQILSISSSRPLLNVDQFYLELTKAVMEVGDIHE